MAVKRRGGLMIDGRQLGMPSAGSSNDLFRVDLSRDEFTQALKTKGLPVTWSRAMLCPNRDGVSPRQHSIDCTFCDGTGLIYYGDISTRMLVQGVKLEQQFYAYGRGNPGSAVLTALPEIKLNFWDKVTLECGSVRFTELVLRQPGTLQDRTKYAPLSVCAVAWKDRTGALQTFEEGVDVVPSSDGLYLEWADDAVRPDDRAFYTVSYLRRPIYVVLDLLHQLRDSPVANPATGGEEVLEFPVQAMAQMDFLVRDESLDPSGEQNHNKNPFPS